MTEEDTFKALKRKPLIELELIFSDDPRDGRNYWDKLLQEYGYTHEEWRVWANKTYNRNMARD